MRKSKLSFIVFVITLALLTSTISAQTDQLTQNPYRDNSLLSLKNIIRSTDGSNNNL